MPGVDRRPTGGGTRNVLCQEARLRRCSDGKTVRIPRGTAAAQAGDRRIFLHSTSARYAQHLAGEVRARVPLPLRGRDPHRRRAIRPTTSTRTSPGDWSADGTSASGLLTAAGWPTIAGTRLGHVEPEHSLGAGLTLPEDAIYMHRAFTLPSYRGNRLHEATIHHAVQMLREWASGD